MYAVYSVKVLIVSQGFIHNNPSCYQEWCTQEHLKYETKLKSDCLSLANNCQLTTLMPNTQVLLIRHYKKSLCLCLGFLWNWCLVPCTCSCEVLPQSAARSNEMLRCLTRRSQSEAPAVTWTRSELVTWLPLRAHCMFQTGNVRGASQDSPRLLVNIYIYNHRHPPQLIPNVNKHC